ncbi:hypothetical protein BASA83_006112 [Batrachochytrium salamandrivorans]|nr:hypothetical protein BASA83_006112 [Batrachochytrium salamandrivorans]
MKLISFAALSFLAITVSAYPGDNTLPQSTAIQSAEQSQSTATQSEEQPQSTTTQSQEQSQSTDIQSAEKSQDEVRAEIERLERIHKEKERLLTRAKKTSVHHNAKFYHLGTKLTTLGLNCKILVLVVRKTNTQVRLLEENQALLAEYNADHVAQMGTSLNSFYNLVLLEEQYDEIATNIEMLSYENARINSAGPAFLVDTLPARLKKMRISYGLYKDLLKLQRASWNRGVFM